MAAEAGGARTRGEGGYRDTFLRDPGAGHRDILTNGGLGQGIRAPQRQVRSRRGGARRARGGQGEGAGRAWGGCGEGSLLNLNPNACVTIFWSQPFFFQEHNS